MAIYEFEFSFPRAFLVKIYQKRFCQSRIEYSASYVAPNCDIKQCTVITTNDKNTSHCMSIVGSNSKETEVVLQLQQLAIDVSKSLVKLNLYEVVDRQLGFLPSPSNDLECPTTLELVDLIFPISFLAKCVKNKAGISFQQNAWYQGEQGAILPCVMTISSGSFSDDDEQRVLFLLSGIDVSNNPTPITVKFMVTSGEFSQMSSPNISTRPFLPVTNINMLTTPNAENTVLAQQGHTDLPCSQNNNTFVNQPLPISLYSRNDDSINDIKSSSSLSLQSQSTELSPRLILPGVPDISPRIQFSTSLASPQNNPPSAVEGISVNTSTPSVIDAENTLGDNNEATSYGQSFAVFVTDDFSHKDTNEIAEIVNDGPDLQDNAVQHTALDEQGKEPRKNAHEIEQAERQAEMDQDTILDKIQRTPEKPCSGTQGNVEIADAASLQKDQKHIEETSSLIEGSTEGSLASTSGTVQACNVGEDISCTLQTRGVDSETDRQENKEDEVENNNGWSICGQSLQDITMSDLSENETVHLIIGGERKDGRRIESKSETHTSTNIGDEREKVSETSKKEVESDSKVGNNLGTDSPKTTENDRSNSADVRVETKLSSSPKTEENFMDIVDPVTGLIESVRIETNVDDRLTSPESGTDDSITVQSQQSANHSVKKSAEKACGTGEEFVKNIVSQIKKLSKEEEERQKLYTVDTTHSRKSENLSTGHKKEASSSCKEFQKSWLKEFSWLKYDPEKKKMFCTYCMKAGMSTVYTQGCGSMRKKSLQLHNAASTHIQATLRSCPGKVVMRLDADSEEVISTIVKSKADQGCDQDVEKDEPPGLNNTPDTVSVQDCRSTSPENVKSRELTDTVSIQACQISSPENAKNREPTNTVPVQDCKSLSPENIKREPISVKQFVPTDAKLPVVRLEDASKSPEFKKYFRTGLSGPINISRLHALQDKLKNFNKKDDDSGHFANDFQTSASVEKNNCDVKKGRMQRCKRGQHLIKKPSVKVEKEEQDSSSGESSKSDKDLKKRKDSHSSAEQCKKVSENEDSENDNSVAKDVSSDTSAKRASNIERKRRNKCRRGMHLRKERPSSKKVIDEKKNGDSGRSSKVVERRKKQKHENLCATLVQCKTASDDDDCESARSGRDVPSRSSAEKNTSRIKRGRPTEVPSVCVKVENEEKDDDTGKYSKVDVDLTLDECEELSVSSLCEPKEQESRKKTVPKHGRVKPVRRGKRVFENDHLLISYLLNLVDCDSEIPAESVDTKPWRPVIVLEDIENDLRRTDSSAVKSGTKSLSWKSRMEVSPQKSEIKSTSQKSEMKSHLSEKSSSRKGTKRKSSKVASDQDSSSDEECNALCVPHVDNVLTPISFSDDSDFETENVLGSIPSWEDIMKGAIPESEPKSTLKSSSQRSGKFKPLKWESTAEPQKRKLDKLNDLDDSDNPNDLDDSGSHKKSPYRMSDNNSEVFGRGSEKSCVAAVSNVTNACDMMSLSDDFDLTEMMMCHVVLTRCDK